MKNAYEIEEKIKAEAAYQAQAKCEDVPRPSTIGEINEGCRISLREQIEGRFHQTQMMANESNKLRLLRRMIDQQPETFALISLMRDLNLI